MVPAISPRYTHWAAVTQFAQQQAQSVSKATIPQCNFTGDPKHGFPQRRFFKRRVCGVQVIFHGPPKGAMSGSDALALARHGITGVGPPLIGRAMAPSSSPGSEPRPSLRRLAPYESTNQFIEKGRWGGCSPPKVISFP